MQLTTVNITITWQYICVYYIHRGVRIDFILYFLSYSQWPVGVDLYTEQLYVLNVVDVDVFIHNAECKCNFV